MDEKGRSEDWRLFIPNMSVIYSFWLMLFYMVNDTSVPELSNKVAFVL